MGNTLVAVFFPFDTEPNVLLAAVVTVIVWKLSLDIPLPFSANRVVVITVLVSFSFSWSSAAVTAATAAAAVTTTTAAATTTTAAAAAAAAAATTAFEGEHAAFLKQRLRFEEGRLMDELDRPVTMELEP